MVLSLDPVERSDEFQEMAPTRFVCPCSTRTRFILLTSQICTSPLFVPTEKCGPFLAQQTEVAESEMPRSHNLVTFELAAFQRQTLEARPTARKFWVDQSIRLRQQSSWRAGASRTLHGSLFIFLRFFVHNDTSSPKSKLELLLTRAVSLGRGSVLSEYLKMFAFQKVAKGLDLLLPLSMMNLRQMSEMELLSSFPFQACSSASSQCISESRFSSFLLGMQRSVMAQLSPSCNSAMLLHSTNGRKTCYRSAWRDSYLFRHGRSICWWLNWSNCVFLSFRVFFRGGSLLSFAVSGRRGRDGFVWRSWGTILGRVDQVIKLKLVLYYPCIINLILRRRTNNQRSTLILRYTRNQDNIIEDRTLWITQKEERKDRDSVCEREC